MQIKTFWRDKISPTQKRIIVVASVVTVIFTSLYFAVRQPPVTNPNLVQSNDKQLNIFATKKLDDFTLASLSNNLEQIHDNLNRLEQQQQQLTADIQRLKAARDPHDQSFIDNPVYLPEWNTTDAMLQLMQTLRDYPQADLVSKYDAYIEEYPERRNKELEELLDYASYLRNKLNIGYSQQQALENGLIQPDYIGQSGGNYLEALPDADTKSLYGQALTATASGAATKKSADPLASFATGVAPADLGIGAGQGMVNGNAQNLTTSAIDGSANFNLATAANARAGFAGTVNPNNNWATTTGSTFWTGSPGANSSGRNPLPATRLPIYSLASVQKTTSPAINVPAGSVFTGQLITGVDAATSDGAKADPYPVLVKLTALDFLPNNYAANLQSCFVLLSSYGDLSSQRAFMRTQSLSCINKDGYILEGEVKGYAVGADGKLGIAGRLVSKQGSLIAKSLSVGFLQGLSEALTRPNIYIGATTNNNPASLSWLQQAGLNGVGKAVDKVANFYLNLANKMFPLIEVAAGETIDLVITAPLSLKVSKRQVTANPLALASSRDQSQLASLQATQSGLVQIYSLDSTNNRVATNLAVPDQQGNGTNDYGGNEFNISPPAPATVDDSLSLPSLPSLPDLSNLSDAVDSFGAGQ